MGSMGFDGSQRGDGSRLAPHTRLECKVCWWIYDPALGDAQWQIPAGTPFSALPAFWTCPRCDGAADQFIPIEEAA